MGESSSIQQSESMACMEPLVKQPIVADDPNITASINRDGRTLSDSRPPNGSQHMKVYWDAFERVICLNLRERVDRYDHCIREFAKVGILDRVEFQINDRSPKGGMYGCSESHLKAIRSAYDAGCNNALIMEDDCSFRHGWEQIIIDSSDFIRSSDPLSDWEVLNMSGQIIYGIEDCPWNKNIFNGKAFLAHIYCISRMGMKRILFELYPNGPSLYHCLDVAFAYQLRRAYVHKHHSIIIQLMEEFGSDHTWNDWSAYDPVLVKFVQTNILPLYYPFQCEAALFMMKYIPWSLRPWIFDPYIVCDQLHNEDIIMIRNGQEISIKWKTTIFTFIFKMLMGIVIIYIILRPSTVIPTNMNRFNVLITFLKMSQ